MHFLSNEGLLDDGSLRARTMVIPDLWIEQGPIPDQYDIAGLNEPHIAAKVEALVQGLREHRVQRRNVVDIKAEAPVVEDARRTAPLTPAMQ